MLVFLAACVMSRFGTPSQTSPPVDGDGGLTYVGDDDDTAAPVLGDDEGDVDVDVDVDVDTDADADSGSLAGDSGPGGYGGSGGSGSGSGGSGGSAGGSGGSGT